jgi:hypothetical protein
VPRRRAISWQRGAALEVPPQLSHRERLRTRRAGKSDPGDVLAIAQVTQRGADLPPVRRSDASRELGLLVEAREDLVAGATRVRTSVFEPKSGDKLQLGQVRLARASFRYGRRRP